MNYKKSIAAFVSLIILSSLFIPGCDDEDPHNPFSGITTLDCRNLIIRKVALNGNFVEVSLENTCKSCEDDWVYLGMVMIDKTTVAQDTIAQTECLTCHPCPKNGETLKYQLITSLTSLPDLKNVQFNFGYLCTDVTYLKK